MAEDHFRVIYDGRAVDDGEMDAAQLASSLLALASLVTSADAITTGQPDRVQVRVRADAKRGSFDIGMVVHSSEAVLAWAMTPKGAGTISILNILGFNITSAAKVTIKGVIQVVRWLNGRRIASKKRSDDGSITLTTEDGEELVVDAQVARLADEPTVRQPLEKFTDPLREEGIDAIHIKPVAGDGVTISAGEADAFRAISGTAPTSSSEFEATYQIKRLFFDRGRKWRLSNGAQTIQAEIIDDRFWNRIDSSQESFAKEDFLVCKVRMDQWFANNGLRTEYVIIRVDEHISPPKQGNLI